jgi:predicted PurR-regulated permease PerM
VALTQRALRGQAPAPTDTSMGSALSNLRALASLATGTVIIAALYFGREIFEPIVVAILLSFMLAPVVRLLRRASLGRVPAVFLAAFLGLATLLSVGGLIGMQMTQVISDLPRYATVIEQKLGNIRGLVARTAAVIIGALEPARTAPPSAAGPSAPDVPKPIPVEMHAPDLTPMQIAERIVTPVAGPLAAIAVIFIVAIFILLQQADLRDRFIRLSGLGDLNRTTRALDDAVRRLSRYLLTQLGLNTCFGIIIGSGLFLIGIPYAALWGILAGLFRFVPYIGSLSAAALPLLLAAAVDPGWTMAIETFALFVLVEGVMGQFVDPLAYGRSTGLSPLAVIVAAMFWSWMWGAVGLILSMPLTVCLVVLGRYVQQLEFLDVLMGDRPALTAVESFYQRILANDPDEALEAAQALLKDRSLSTYYDEVAIRGLQLAAVDAERGALVPGLIVRINISTQALIDDLGNFDDFVPATAKPVRPETTAGLDSTTQQVVLESPAETEHLAQSTPVVLVGKWANPMPVLCVTGGGPFDSAVSDIMVQLLAKNGIAARAVPFDAASRDAIAELDFSGSALVCLCYLDISLSPTQIRYLVRRIRRAAPGIPVVAGLWSNEDEDISEDRLQAAIGADYFADTLRAAVDICVKLARGETLARYEPVK